MTIAQPLTIPQEVQYQPCRSEILIRNLNNPRGLRLKQDGSLLLVEAGNGNDNGNDQTPASGRLLQFKVNEDGGFLAAEILTSGFRSMNMQSRMCRDEIFGLADIAYGGGRWLLSETNYVSGSRIMDVTTLPPVSMIESRGNLNALCYHPQRKSWLTVKPDTNQAIEFIEGQPEKVLANLPDLASGQHAVPVTLLLDQSMSEEKTQPVLISLFSGELQTAAGEAEKTGINFQRGAGKILRLDLDSGALSSVVEGLTLPTGLAFTTQGQLLALELCEDFYQPMPPDHVPAFAWHGGFQRYSGRLLSIDMQTGVVTCLARQLDTPSNLCVTGDTVLISEGMGLPGRLIPDMHGEPTPLQGYVRKLYLPGSQS